MDENKEKQGKRQASLNPKMWGELARSAILAVEPKRFRCMWSGVFCYFMLNFYLKLQKLPKRWLWCFFLPLQAKCESESVSRSVMSDSEHHGDCSLPGFSVHEILQARILEWIAMPFSRGSAQPRDWTQVSCIMGGFFTLWATSEGPLGVGKWGAFESLPSGK